jgi:hypothetical protein
LITHVCKRFIDAILRHGAGPGSAVSAAVGWLLAVAAVAAGYVGYGWRGVILAVTVIVFWLLLQFSRALRVMQGAAKRPVGHVDSAVMLQSRLHVGMTLAQLLKLTGSFGQRRSTEPESYAWADGAGDEVVVELHGGKLSRWRLQRAAPPSA